jgi:hypothetical protein
MNVRNNCWKRDSRDPGPDDDQPRGGPRPAGPRTSEANGGPLDADRVFE